MKESLEDRGYLATEKDVLANARDILHSRARAVEGKCVYLRALVAVAQVEIKAEGLLGEKGRHQHVVFNQVNRRFYKIVVAVNEAAVPETVKDRAHEINRRTNYARTAAYAVRMWMAAGNDLLALDARTVTKETLKVAEAGNLLESRPTTVQEFRILVHDQTQTLTENLSNMAELDWAAASAEIQTVIDSLSDQLRGLSAAHMSGMIRSNLFGSVPGASAGH
jgi:hypothetical protein